MIGALSVGEKRTEHMDQGKGGSQSNQAAQNRDDDRLDQDLDEDIGGGGADGFANANFPNALRDTGEHDVHDANAHRPAG